MASTTQGAHSDISPTPATTARGPVRQVATGAAVPAAHATSLAERDDARLPVGVGAMDGVRGVRADAYGANIDVLNTCLYCTSAEAGPNSTGAEARALRPASEPVAEGQIPANGYGNGALLRVPANSLLTLAIGDWDGFTRNDHRTSQAHAHGAVLEFALGDGGPAAATVGESRSDAFWSRSGSYGSSESTGARASLASGRLVLVLLHSQGSSQRPGSLELVSVNGAETVPAKELDEGNEVTNRVAHVTVLRTDRNNAVVAKVDDGKAQQVISLGTTWVGSPSADPQPLN